MTYKFYDGPPFASGDPHYGHLLASTIKDAIPRYRTMRGYRVDRKWWWDCHGLPAENFVEKQLGIQWRKEIEEKIWVETFVEACRSAVMQVNENWKWFVDHVGRWVDIDNAYFTMSKDFMESVIRVFGAMYDKNLIYKGFKIQWYCPNCATPLSNYEITQWYEDKQDPAVTVKFELYDAATYDYETTDNWFGSVVLWVLQHEDKVLMVFDTRSGKWFIPGGKVDLWETPEQAVARELEEEIWVRITSTSLQWNTKVPHHSKLRNLHIVSCEYEGEFENKEPEKQWAIAWVSKIEYENDLWYAIKIDMVDSQESLIISDVDQIEYEFADYHMVVEKKYDYPGMGTWSVSMLAWTTTPWTLPSNMFAAVHNDIVYAVVFMKEEQTYYIVAKSLLWKIFKDADAYIITYYIKWNHFVGLHYTPLFDYYYTSPHIAKEYHTQVHKVLHADFVTEESGTGIAHEAPAFGEDDYQLVMQYLPQDKAKEWLFHPVNEFAEYTAEIPEREGVRVFDANKDIIKTLKENWTLFHQGTIDHSYPHCWRCDTPLIYKAIDGWFVKETQLKEQVVESAQALHFVPAPIKKRFINWLAGAPDWNISRNRFWWSPIPVWECEGCEERIVCKSIEEIQKYSWQEVTDLHKPYIDQITIPCPGCQKDMSRTPEVLDCWFESWSMPYGQDHVMHTNEVVTADFIAEWLDQTRGWFRTLHVVGNAVDNKQAFKNVIVNGLILAEDGKKMSKRLKNYPDPKWLFENYWADAFRLYVLWSPVVRGEPLRFVEQWVEQVLKDFVIPFQNVWNFFSTYARVDNWKTPDSQIFFMRHAKKAAADNVEDQAIPLSEEGKAQLLSDEFREKVVRIDPDVIYVSPSIRAQQTAAWVVDMLEKTRWKKVEIVVDERLLIGSVHAHYLVEELQEIGQRVLLVSHAGVFTSLWESMVDRPHTWLGYTEVVSTPCVPLKNELDQWIFAEMYTTLDIVDAYVEAYELEPAVRALMACMDNVTNWYLRRSRRRFWASGLDEDKQAAYRTLYTIIWLYAKIAAPFAPFVSEWIWQNMNEFVSWEKDRWSIHLSYWPLKNPMFINQQLMQEISTVRKIIKWAMYLRAKHQIKVKQPLPKLWFSI